MKKLLLITIVALGTHYAMSGEWPYHAPDKLKPFDQLYIENKSAHNVTVHVRQVDNEEPIEAYISDYSQAKPSKTIPGCLENIKSHYATLEGISFKPNHQILIDSEMHGGWYASSWVNASEFKVKIDSRTFLVKSVGMMRWLTWDGNDLTMTSVDPIGQEHIVEIEA